MAVVLVLYVIGTVTFYVQNGVSIMLFASIGFWIFVAGWWWNDLLNSRSKSKENKE
jgi:hypothetical protein